MGDLVQFPVRIEPGTPADLERTLEHLYTGPDAVYGHGHLPCKCEHEYLSLGRLGHISMGMAWLRTTTHPDCPHHGLEAQRHFMRHGRWPS